MNRDVHKMREEYLRAELNEADVASNPLQQFDQWFKEAVAHPNIQEANAMVLATANAEGRPAARMLLMKSYAPEGISFYTNYESRKGHDLECNPRGSLLFYWQALERQVRIEGPVQRLNTAESDEYFASRPFGSRIGASASPQSWIIENREVLDQKVAQLELLHQDGQVPRPANWGGYILVPEYYEFWQGRSNRLHDRLVYIPCGNDGWDIKRLAP